jgi:hypothetical protein
MCESSRFHYEVDYIISARTASLQKRTFAFHRHFRFADERGSFIYDGEFSKGDERTKE